MRIFQKDAYIGIDFLEKKTEIIKLHTPDDKDAFTFDIESQHGVKTIAVLNPEVKEINAIRAELESFKSSIEENRPVVVSEVDGLLAMDVAHQILHKIQSNILPVATP